jgi:protein-disulfide isomerase
MPSGKKSKEMRRAAQVKPPPVVSKGGVRRRQASPRVLMAGGGIVAVIAIVIVLAVVLGSGGGNSGLPKGIPAVGSPTSAVALPNSVDVEQLFKGIPQKGNVLGKPSAPVTMVEYIDLQCPVCQAFETSVFPDLVSKYIRPGKVKVVVRPWAFIGPDSFRGQAATIAAERQNKAFDFAQLLYYNQGPENTGWLTDSVIATDAASIRGMQVRQLLADRGSSSVKAEVKTVEKQVAVDKVNATPSLFVGRTGKKLTHVPLQNGLDKTTIVDALDTALAGT